MALVIEVKVIPNSKKFGFSLESSGIIKCGLKSQPEKGKANEELVKLLSKTLHIPQQSIKIISGYTSRKKVIKLDVDELTLPMFYQLCNIESEFGIK